jgi:hypothetical protein
MVEQVNWEAKKEKIRAQTEKKRKEKAEAEEQQKDEPIIYDGKKSTVLDRFKKKMQRKKAKKEEDEQ